MIELLTVITIIVLMLAMAIPLVRVVEGNRSLDAGYNAIAAALGHARQIALYYRQPAGLIFYRDPNSGVQDIAYVMRANFLASNYQNFPNYPAAAGLTTSAMVQAVATLPDSYLDIVPGESLLTLPTGLAVQMVIGNGAMPPRFTIGNGLVTLTEKYIRVGVVLFDEDGQLVSTPYAISYFSTVNVALWGASLNTTTAPYKYSTVIYDASPSSPATAAVGLNPASLFTHSAICLYDDEAYLNQIDQFDTNVQDQFSDANNNTLTYNSNSPVGSGQYFAGPAMSPFAAQLATQGAFPPEIATNTNATVADFEDDKYAEQNWLVQNGEVFVIKPNDGSLLRNK